MKSLDEYIEYLESTIRMHEDLRAEIESDTVKKGLKNQISENVQLKEWLTDYRDLKEQQAKMIDGDLLMISLTDWWYSSFGLEETEEAAAIRKVMDQVEESIKQFRAEEAKE